MTRVWTLAALAALALPASAYAAGVTGDSVATTARVPGGTVTGVSVVPVSGRAEIVIAVDTSVSIADFTLTGPDRIVLDLSGAALKVPPRFYDKVVRGGITNVRFAQYRADVVRVVVDLDASYKYEVTRAGSEVRVSVTNQKAGEFAAWHSGRPVAGPAVARGAKRAPAADAAPAAEVLPVTDVVETTVAAAETVAPEKLAAASNTFAAQSAQQSSQPRITVTYQDADIRDVLAAFAAFSGRTIVVGKQVAGNVTAEIRDQPWDVALQAILTSQGLAATEDAYGIITVDSYGNISSKQASEPLVTQLVSVNYAKASSLVPTITALLARDCSQPEGGQRQSGGQVVNGCLVRGSVTADTATNTLLITEAQSRLGDVISYVRDLDIRTPQVAIKAKIIFVSRTDIEELGITYDLGSAGTFFNSVAPRVDPTTNKPYGNDVQSVISVGGEALAGVANANRNFRGTAAISLLYSTMIGKFDLTAFIDALQEVRLADTQAEPNIVTLDNRPARILVGEETPIRVIDASSGGAGGVARANVTFKETGIILNVTPHITNNRQIMMTLQAEQSQLQSAPADLGYTFLKRQASTQLLVNDGETAVLGGLTITQVTTSKVGIPFLVDLPLIGRLFGETRKSEQKQDLLILITPHIVDEGEAVRSEPSRRG